MPLANLVSLHTIDVLALQVTRGAAMSAQRAYVPAGQKKCHVMPLKAADREVLLKIGYEVDHEIWFNGNPNLANGTRIRWKGTVMRIVPAIDPMGFGTLYVMYAKTYSEDNQQVHVPD